jgi:replicative DNA helicase
MGKHKHNPDLAERALLGSLLRDGDALDDVATIIDADDFRTDAHRRLFTAIVALRDVGKPVSLVAVAEALQQRGDVDEVGYPYLAELFEDEPTGGNAIHYAKLVKQRSLRRALARVGAEIQREAENPAGTAEEAVADAERRIFALAERGVADGVHDAPKVVGELYDRLDARRQRGAASCGLPTGFFSLDDYLTGLPPSELIVIAARPGIGKTSLAVALARRAALVEGVGVLFISLEQARVELFERLLCGMASVDGQNVRRGSLTDEEARRFLAAGDEVRKAPLFIDDAANQRMLRIAATARRLKRRKGVGLVVVDYLQLIEPDNRKVPRHEQVADVSRRLKILARELAVPVVALAQLNRASEARENREPRLSDLRESGGIEADADTVLLLHRPEAKEPGESAQQDRIVVHIAKQRNGPTAKVVLRFERRFLRFVDPADGPFARGAP